jgi:hypothetical protein
VRQKVPRLSQFQSGHGGLEPHLRCTLGVRLRRELVALTNCPTHYGIEKTPTSAIGYPSAILTTSAKLHVLHGFRNRGQKRAF